MLIMHVQCIMKKTTTFDYINIIKNNEFYGKDRYKKRETIDLKHSIIVFLMESLISTPTSMIVRKFVTCINGLYPNRYNTNSIDTDYIT
jgi:hypothetical protein